MLNNRAVHFMIRTLEGVFVWENGGLYVMTGITDKAMVDIICMVTDYYAHKFIVIEKFHVSPNQYIDRKF